MFEDRRSYLKWYWISSIADLGNWHILISTFHNELKIKKPTKHTSKTNAANNDNFVKVYVIDNGNSYGVFSRIKHDVAHTLFSGNMISQIILVVERLMTIFARMNVGLCMLDGHVPIHTTGKIRHHVAELALKYFSAFIVNSFANVFIGRRLVIPTKTWIASLSLSMISRIRIGCHMFNIWNKSLMIQKCVTLWQSLFIMIILDM